MVPTRIPEHPGARTCGTIAGGRKGKPRLVSCAIRPAYPPATRAERLEGCLRGFGGWDLRGLLASNNAAIKRALHLMLFRFVASAALASKSLVDPDMASGLGLIAGDATGRGGALWSASAEFRSERNGDGALAENGLAYACGIRTSRLAIGQSGVALRLAPPSRAVFPPCRFARTDWR